MSEWVAVFILTSTSFLGGMLVVWDTKDYKEMREIIRGCESELPMNKNCRLIAVPQEEILK